MTETFTPAETFDVDTAAAIGETSATDAAKPSDVRAWARSQGRTDVGDRGRLSRTVKEEFTKSTGRPVA